MLKKIRIRNFKSIKEVNIQLQQVNLLIGPNNSGKSNFLFALEFFSDFFYGTNKYKNEFDNFSFRGKENNNKKDISMIFNLKNDLNFHFYYYLFSAKKDFDFVNYQCFYLITKENDFIDYTLLNDFSAIQNMIVDNKYCVQNFLSQEDEIYNLSEKIRLSQHFNDTHFSGLTIFPSTQKSHKYGKSKYVHPFPAGLSLGFTKEITELFNNLKVYKPEVIKIKNPIPIGLEDKYVSKDSSNLVSFLDNMRDEQPNIYKQIEKDIKIFVNQFEGFRFKKVKVKNDERIYKKFGLANKKGQTFWSDELSDGILYFIAILAILHQPNSPKLLLLEEPESYIHPHRIQEIMNLIFQIAEEKNIQIILTTHSPIVVDEFDNIYEAVNVFEMKNGVTSVKNLKNDIIEKKIKKIKEKNLPEINFTKGMGENWILGLLGGVPND